MTGYSGSMKLKSSWTSAILGDDCEPHFEHKDTRHPSPNPKRHVLHREHEMLKEKIKRRQPTSVQTSTKSVASPFVPLRPTIVKSTSYVEQKDECVTSSACINEDEDAKVYDDSVPLVPISFKTNKGTDLNTQYRIKMLDIIPIGPKKSANQIIFKDKIKMLDIIPIGPQKSVKQIISKEVFLEEKESKDENDHINLDGSNLLAKQSNSYELHDAEFDKPCVEIDNMPADFSASCDDILYLPTEFSAPCNDILDLSTQMSAPCDEITTLPAELDESCFKSETSNPSEFPVADMRNVKLIKHDDVLAKISIANSLFYVMFDKPIALSSVTDKVAEIPCLKTLDGPNGYTYMFNLIGNYGVDEKFHVYQLCITYDNISALKRIVWSNAHHDMFLNHVTLMDNLMPAACSPSLPSSDIHLDKLINSPLLPLHDTNIDLQNRDFLKGRDNDMGKIHTETHAYSWTDSKNLDFRESNLNFTCHARFICFRYDPMILIQWHGNIHEHCFNFCGIACVETIVHIEACDVYIYAAYTLFQFCIGPNISENTSNSRRGGRTWSSIPKRDAHELRTTQM